MRFGLLPKFSTPVEKPVENEGVLILGTLETPVSRHFFEAKGHGARFEAILWPVKAAGASFQASA
jgi:hypothetical protein